jgi:uncharacterized metal-binding protein (TIGR02443 family)
MPSRFIAGAVCPACGALDRIVVEGDLDDRLRRCVECNFREALAVQSSMEESPRSDTAIDVVRLVGDPDGVDGFE